MKNGGVGHPSAEGKQMNETANKMAQVLVTLIGCWGDVRSVHETMVPELYRTLGD